MLKKVHSPRSLTTNAQEEPLVNEYRSLGARLEQEIKMTLTLPIHAELVSAFEIAFEGCGTTLSSALESPDYSRLLAMVQSKPAFSREAHVCESLLGHFAISKEMSDYMRSNVRPSQSMASRCIQDEEVANEEVTALIFLLGETLIQTAREHCLDNQARNLAARWRETHLKGGDGIELARELYDWLRSFRRRSQEVIRASEHDQLQLLKSAAMWWVDDQQRQTTDLFLPLPLAEPEGDSPNCQGLALLACAFAAEAEVPNLRTNLLATGRTLTEATATRTIRAIAEIIQESGLKDMTEVLRAVNFQILYDGLDRQSRVDFHSGCLIQCGSASYIVDPYALTIYQIRPDSRSPFDLVEESSLPGFNAPAQYLDFNGTYFVGVEEAAERWAQFFREELPKLQGLDGGSSQQLCESLRAFMIASYRFDHEVKGHESAEFSSDQCPDIVATIKQSLDEGCSCREVIELVIHSAFCMALDFEERLTDALESRMAYSPPIACEYGRSTYCTGFTTVQTIAVLQGLGHEAVADIASYGCDQSVLYLLAKCSIDKHNEGEKMSALGAIVLHDLWRVFPPALHPATRQLLDETGE